MNARISANAHWLIIGIILIVVYFVSQGVVGRFFPAASPYYPPTFSVTADEKYPVKAESANVRMFVSAKAKTKAEAMQNVKKVYDTIVSNLKVLGIEPKDITTQNYQVYDSYDNSGQVKTGEESSVQFTVKVINIDKIGQVQDTAYAAGVTSIDGVDYNYATNNPAEDDARKKAFENARQKAENMAKVARRKLGNMTTVSEYKGSTTSTPDSSGSSNPSEIKSEETLSITLTYELN